MYITAMLKGEEIWIGNTKVLIMDIGEKRVKIGINAPMDVKITGRKPEVVCGDCESPLSECICADSRRIFKSGVV